MPCALLLVYVTWKLALVPMSCCANAYDLPYTIHHRGPRYVTIADVPYLATGEYHNCSPLQHDYNFNRIIDWGPALGLECQRNTGWKGVICKPTFLLALLAGS